MANRPFVYGFLDRLLTNIDPDYAANNLNMVGVKPGQVILSRLQNTLGLIQGLWETYFDYKTLRTDDYVDASTAQRWSTDKLEYPNGEDITAAPGVTPSTKGVYWFEGYRVEIDECILQPNGADPLIRPLVAKPGRTWIYLDTSVISDPQQPFASLVLVDVAAGTPAAPGPGQLALVGVDVDAFGLTAGNVYPGIEPAEEIAFNTRLQRYRGVTRFEDTITASKPGALVVNVEGQVSIDGDTITGLSVVNDIAGLAAATITNASGTGASVLGTHATLGALVSENNGAGPSVHAIKTVAGSAVVADSTVGGGTAIEALGGAIGVDASSVGGSAVAATTATGVGFSATSTGSGNAIVSTGGPSIASRAGSFIGGHVSAFVVQATTAAGASSTAVAVRATANGDATAVHGIGLDGYGVIAQTDSSAPKRAALRLAPQDADPTTFLQGDVLFNDARTATGKIRVRTTAWESVHSTPKGRVKEYGAIVAGSVLAGGLSGNLSLVQISPEEIGDVIVTVTANFNHSKDTGFATVFILDTDAAVTINGGGLGVPIRAPDIDSAAVTGRDHAVIAQARYTLPDATARFFAVQLGSNGSDTDYVDLIVTVEGVV